MAMRLIQFEELTDLLSEVPRLVDRLQTRRPDYATAVGEWVKKVEASLEKAHMPVVSGVASLRASLIQAARRIRSNDVSVSGRPTARKIQDATATHVVQKCSQIIADAIAERQTAFEEAERVARQLAILSEAKGIVQECQAMVQFTHQQFLECVQQRIGADAALANLYLHLLSIVGKYDVLVFIDRALATSVSPALVHHPD